MNDCPDGEIRDLLPEYVHGALPAAQHATIAAHLAGCEDCRAEIALIESASRALVVADIDVDTILRALPAPPKRGVRRTFALSAQRVAAGIGIIAIGSLSVLALRGAFRNAPRETAMVREPAVAHTQLAAVPPAQPAHAVVDSPVNPAPPVAAVTTARHPGMSFGGGLSDLSEDQLDTLMGELDELDALPSAEPETHLTPILPPADGGHGAP
jgi:anti-sigma factor RsiW